MDECVEAARAAAMGSELELPRVFALRARKWHWRSRASSLHEASYQAQQRALAGVDVVSEGTVEAIRLRKPTTDAVLGQLPATLRKARSRRTFAFDIRGLSGEWAGCDDIRRVH